MNIEHEKGRPESDLLEAREAVVRATVEGQLWQIPGIAVNSMTIINAIDELLALRAAICKYEKENDGWPGMICHE